MSRRRTISGWALGRRIGTGGNAQVYSATQDGKTAALKILRGRNPKQLARFRDEIAAMQRCADIPGVLPVIDYHVPREKERGPAWIAMGLAQPIKKALRGSSLRE